MYQNFPKDYLIPVINDYINKDNKGFRFIDEFEKCENKYIYCEENENIETHNALTKIIFENTIKA